MGIEIGVAFAIASAVAVWARHDFRLPKRRDTAE